MIRNIVPRDTRRGLQFAAVGLVGVAINNSVLWLLVEHAHVYLLAASVFATEVAIVSNFAMNQVRTFADITTPHSLTQRLVRFNAIALGGLVLTAAGLLFLTNAVHLWYLLANVVAVACGAAWNYVVNRRWTWPSAAPGTLETTLRAPVWLTRRTVMQLLRAAVCAVVALAVLRMLIIVGLLGLTLTALSLILVAQSVFSLYLMLYAWEDPQRLTPAGAPRVFVSPSLSFSVLLPARAEQAVIFLTIRSIVEANYPTDLLEAVVICHEDDAATVAEAQRAILELGASNVRVETFSTGPINKPRALNVGLASTSNSVVTVFDAEDDIDPNIFNLVNTLMLRERVGVVQSGVQLMNYLDHWFSAHNVLEYFFWFKSRLHYHATRAMIPLGGNTVFIRRDLLERVGGWDDTCLTEDADIGVRLSVLGEPIRVIYDPRHVTREETPDSVVAWLRQRTRWHQGFVQVLRKRAWLDLPTVGQRLLAVYTLAYPIWQGVLTLAWPVAAAAVIWLRLPAVVAVATILPLYTLLFQLLAMLIGVVLFAREYNLRLPILVPVAMVVTFLPYQWLLGVASVRAVYREVRHQTNWEKTVHIGAHRSGARPLVLPLEVARAVHSEAKREIA